MDDRITDEELDRLRKTVGLLQYDTAFNIGSTLLSALEAERAYATALKEELDELRILCEFYAFMNENPEEKASDG